jgi:hypothetical protein
MTSYSHAVRNALTHGGMLQERAVLDGKEAGVEAAREQVADMEAQQAALEATIAEVRFVRPLQFPAPVSFLASI